jgi:replicative DNA helicase
MIGQAEQRIRSNAYEKGTNSNAALDLPEFFFRFERQGATTTHFSTGISRLDQSLNGGIGGLTFLLGDKGVGKTSLLLSCIMETLDDPEACVLFYSLDMLKDDILSRIWCRELRTPRRELQRNSFSDLRNRQVVDDVTAKLRRLRIVERDYSTTRDEYDDAVLHNGMSHQIVLNQAIALQKESGARKLLIVVDLFQKMITPSSVAVSESDTYRLDVFNQLTSSLRLYFGGKEFAFLVTSEMRKRDGKKSGNRPTIDDMKGDGRIASDADSVLVLSPTRRVNESTNIVCLDIAKGREGIIRGEHELTFQHMIGRFEGSSEPPRCTDAATTETIYDE